MSKAIGHLKADTARRFRAERQRAQERMGIPELRNDQFVTLLLDVYEFHLDDGGDQAEEVVPVVGGASA